MEEKELNLKPFNLEDAKLGKPICTRDGKEVRVVCFNRKCEVYPILALVTNDVGKEIIGTYTIDGLYQPDKEGFLDLMMASEERVGYINIYRDFERRLSSEMIYPTIDEAVKNKVEKNYIGTIKIKWKE